jgi:general stress protein 26
MFTPNSKSASKNNAYFPITIEENGIKAIHNKYMMFNHTNGTVNFSTRKYSWWYKQNAPTNMKQTAQRLIVGN